MHLNSVMKHNFSQIPSANIERSMFDRSHGYKTTFNASDLVPIFVDEVLPGDTMSLKANLFARLATPIKPFMDNLFMETFWFFVPDRLVWENWEKFMANPVDNGFIPGDPESGTTYEIPQWISGEFGFSEGTLADYFGIPIGKTISVSALPMRKYYLIYNEWFRDQNLLAPVAISKGDGPDYVDGDLYRRCKKHDYFTSCLPWPQKGPAVQLPIGSTAPVWGNQYALQLNNGSNPTYAFQIGSTSATTPLHAKLMYKTDYVDVNAGETVYGDYNSGSSAMGVVTKDSGRQSGLYADLSEATAATINSMREAFALQRFFERDARGGSARYTEVIRSHFGVVSPDSRLQRPELLAISSERININPVQQTSETSYTGSPATVKSAQGNLAAFGVVYSDNASFNKSFVEHGHIIGIVNVRADITYQQGLNKMWSRMDRYDFYWPTLSHLGEQEVLNKEIFYSANAELDENVFGYQERYAEYRYKPSLITGKFRSDNAQSLDFWHLSEDFASLPALNSTFINDKSKESIERVIAVQDEPQFLLDCYFNYKCARPMPTYSVPGMIDHF